LIQKFGSLNAMAVAARFGVGQKAQGSADALLST
jgi:hypothetical protein